MRVVLERVNGYVLAVSRAKFIAISLIVSILVRFAFNNIVLLMFPQDAGLTNPFMDKKDIIVKLLMSLVLAPVIETFLFFFLPFKAIKIAKARWTMIPFTHSFIILSSLLFALNHSFSTVYFLTSLFGGLIMSVFYLFSIKRDENPYQNTTMLHCFYNLFVALSKYL